MRVDRLPVILSCPASCTMQEVPQGAKQGTATAHVENVRFTPPRSSDRRLLCHALRDALVFTCYMSNGKPSNPLS